MPTRYPRTWLMTDERMGDALWSALDRLPRGSGIVFRHHGLSERERRAMWPKLLACARRRGLVVLSTRWVRPGADGVHNPAVRPMFGIVTRSAHNRREIVAARRGGADVVFVSPVFPTRSHPDARPLGSARLGLLVRGSRGRFVALGGMDERRFRSLRPLSLHGWAAIDAWMDQNRKAVPM